MLEKRADSDSNKENLRRRILVPLGVGLVVLIATCVISIQQTQKQHIHSEIDRHLAGVRDLMASEYEAEAVDLSVIVDLLETDPALQVAWKARDRQALLNLAAPILQNLSRQERLTHLYFIDTNRVCFLRVHRPEMHDDTISRFTLDQAVQTGEPAHGLELGEFGTLAFRSVHPWKLDDQLVGYIELGQSIDHVLHHLHDIVDIELTVVVQKSNLDSALWTQGQRVFSRAEDWDRFEHCVVIGGTMPEVSNSLGQYMVANHTEHQHEVFDMEHDGQPYMGRPLALLTADGRDIGDILVLKNVSAEKTAQGDLTVITVTAGVIVGSILLVLCSFILKRIEGKLARTRKDWMSEIAERKRVMEELAGHNDFMKNVFESLTHPFYVIDAKTYRVLMGNSASGWNEQLTNITCHELTHHCATPCNDPLNVCTLAQARQTKKPVTGERVHYDPEGKERHIEVHGYPILDRNGEVVQLIEYVLDITERKRTEKELIESRTHSRMIIETAGDAYISINAEGIVTDWNRKAEKIFGWLSKEAIGKPLTELIIDSETACLHRKALAHCVDTGQGPILNKRIEVMAQHRNGLSFPVEIMVWATRKNTSVQFNAFITDITERKLAEAETRKFKTIADHAGYGVAIAGLDSKYIYTNESFARMHGRTPDWFLGRRVFATLNRQSRKKAAEVIRNLVEKGQVQPQEFWFHHKEGHDFPGLVSPVMIPDAEGKPAFVAAIVVDISERVRQVSELRKLSAAVNQSANLICISNPDGIIEYVNPEFCRATGYSLEEAVGCKWNLLERERSDENLYGEIWAQMCDGQTWSGNVRSQRKNNELFWARMTITPIFNDSRQIVNHLAVIEDITNEIAAQQRLAESDKLSAIGTLAAGVAHEFKNYLAGIVGNASYALSGLDDSDGMVIARESLTQIVELGERANDVAMSLLTYSKAEPNEITEEDLKAIIENSIRMVEKEIRNQSIEILTHFEDLPPVRVSASKIQQVLLNLIINARHAIDSDGIITISLVRQNDQAVIMVSDTGKGIPAANFSKIFDPFYSTKGVWGKDAVAGTGMGLSICSNIAREHNGDLTVQSMVGVGSTFVFSLPLTGTENCLSLSRSQDNDHLRLLLFSADENLISDYQRQADANGSVLRTVDDVALIGDDLNNVADAVICDARITAHEKLFQMLEVCAKFGVPFVTVNCDDSGCHESSADHNAVSVHVGTPALRVIAESLQTICAPKVNC